MNEIITRLDEIEKKAESILTDAAAEKEKMLKQWLEKGKRKLRILRQKRTSISKIYLGKNCQWLKKKN